MIVGYSSAVFFFFFTIDLQNITANVNNHYFRNTLIYIPTHVYILYIRLKILLIRSKSVIVADTGRQFPTATIAACLLYRKS